MATIRYEFSLAGLDQVERAFARLQRVCARVEIIQAIRRFCIVPGTSVLAKLKAEK
jgi:hypothetical protein